MIVVKRRHQMARNPLGRKRSAARCQEVRAVGATRTRSSACACGRRAEFGQGLRVFSRLGVDEAVEGCVHGWGPEAQAVDGPGGGRR